MDNANQTELSKSLITEGRFLEAQNLLLHSLLLNTSDFSFTCSNQISLSLWFSISDNRMKLFFLSTSPSSHHTTKSSKSDNRKNNVKKANLPFYSKPKLSTSSSTKSTTSSFSQPSSTSPTTVIPQRHCRSPNIRNSDCPPSSSSSSYSLPPLNKFTRQELSIVLHRLGADDKEEGVIPAILADGDGLISVDGIVNTSIDDDELRAAFGVYDADGDGRISADELHCTLLMLGDCDCSVEDCRTMIDGVDSDGDGFVSFDDFVKMMAMDI